MDYSRHQGGSVTARHHNLAHLRTNLGPAGTYRDHQDYIPPEIQQHQEEVKEQIVRNLEITKNPNLYSYPEVLNYNEYDQFVKHQKDDRRDRHLMLRTDDIEGATHKMFNRQHKYGIKTTNFFPEIPNVNSFYNKLNHGLEANNILTHNTPSRIPNKASILKQDFNNEDGRRSRGYNQQRYQSTANMRESPQKQQQEDDLSQMRINSSVQQLDINNLHSSLSKENIVQSPTQQIHLGLQKPLQNVYFSIQNHKDAASGSYTARDQQKQIQVPSKYDNLRPLMTDKYYQQQQNGNNMNPIILRQDQLAKNSQNGEINYTEQYKKMQQEKQMNYYPIITSKDSPFSQILDKNFTQSSNDYGNFGKSQEMAAYIKDLQSRRSQM
ncbi:UNKNOWN [Stylonychia lemnae]|uniref:Uncharacterized protein n=1 Tax=Stylonychia lemnae TaxID=5949 RepID=A0A077ZQ03_STYLE|nr:UNKNOWN [Stylonychia lemnae]|eukprot:CDW71983.1 UNKNOWN [Stylonychia lemnae]